MFENHPPNDEGVAAIADNQGRDQALRGQGQPTPNRRYVATRHSSGSQKENALQKIRNFRVDFGPGKKDILNFTNQLAVMVRAGISLQDSLESIAQQK